MSQALEVQPHGSGFLLENGANTHTPEETGLRLWEKDNWVALSRRRGAGARLTI